MPSNKYQDEYKKFNEKFGLNDFPIKEHYDFKKRMKTFDAFVFDADHKNAKYNLYMECLLDTLTDKLESLTRFEAGKTYDTVNFSLGEFIVGFEKVMQAMHHDELGPSDLPSRKPFEGASFKQVAEAVRIHARNFDRPTHYLLIDDIRKGKMSIDRLESITGSSIQRLNSLRPANAADGWQWSRDLAPDFANVHIAMNAMQDIVSRRTFWQRINPFRWRRNAQEERLLENLNSIHNDITYKCPNRDVDSIYANDRSSVIEGARARLTEFAKNFKLKDLNPEIKATSAKTAKELFADKYLTDRMTKDMIALASKSKVLSGVNKNAATTMWKSSCTFTITSASDIINDMWNKFEKTNDPAEKEKIIADGAINVFKNVNTRMGVLRLEKKDTFVTAQKVTDMLLKTYSPVATDEQYAKYADRYFMTTKGPAATSARNLKIAPEKHLENLEGQLPFWNEVRSELGIEGSASVPTIEEIKASDVILAEEIRKAEAEAAKKKAADDLAAKETAEKMKEFNEKQNAKEGKKDAPAADDKKVPISIPGLSENANKANTSHKIDELKAPAKDNSLHP